MTDQLAKNSAARHWEPVDSGVRNVVLVEWEGFVDPGSYTWESVSNLQNDLGIDVFADFLDALSEICNKCKVFREVTADVAEGNGAPCCSNRLRVRALARGGSLEFPPTNCPVHPMQPVLSRAYTT